MSRFAWLDYSEHERRKALDVIDQFREKDTRDELGIGTVRDALADRLFPGISTIQTRARYLIFIPWIHQSLETDHVRSDDAPRIARHREIKLIHALLESEDHEGIIGRDTGKTNQWKYTKRIVMPISLLILLQKKALGIS